MTYQMAAASSASSITTRSSIPSPRDTPANPAAIPVAKGLTVEPNTPTPAPSMMMDTAVMVSYPAATTMGRTRG